MSLQEPVFRVVRGTPSAEDLAALVGVFLLRGRPTSPAPAARGSLWAAAARAGGGRPGPDAWRRSGLPR